MEAESRRVDRKLVPPDSQQLGGVQSQEKNLLENGIQSTIFRIDKNTSFDLL